MSDSASMRKLKDGVRDDDTIPAPLEAVTKAETTETVTRRSEEVADLGGAVDEVTPATIKGGNDSQDGVNKNEDGVVKEKVSRPNDTTHAPDDEEDEAFAKMENADEAIDASASAVVVRGAEDERDWDKTSHKVTVHNVLKYVRPKEVTKLVDSWLSKLSGPKSVRVMKTKKPPVGNWIQVTLETEDMVEPFLTLINEGRFTNKRGGMLYARRTDPKDDRKDERKDRDRKRKGRDDDGSCRNGDDGRKKRRGNDKPKTADEIRDSITPFWRKTYEDQLDAKWKDLIKNCAIRICKEVKNKFRIIEKESRKNPKHRKTVPMYDWVKRKRAIPIERVLPSPRTTEYRNKTELTFGYRHKLMTAVTEDNASAARSAIAAPSSPDKKPIKLETDKESVSMETDKPSDETNGTDVASVKDSEITKSNVTIKKIPAVGFMASGWSGGVSLPHPCQNIPPEVCGIADIINEFLSTCPIPPYDSAVHRGVWRTVTIRSSVRTKQCMVVIQHAPPGGGRGARENGVDNYSHVWKDERDRLVGMLTSGEIPLPERDYPPPPFTSEAAQEVVAMEGEAGNSREAIHGKEGDGMVKRHEAVRTALSADDAEDAAAPKSSSPPAQSSGPLVTSIFFQEFDGLSTPKPEHPVQHLFGKAFMEEMLNQCTFQISPGAFFQVNTEGAEVLYNVVVEKVREISGGNPKDTLLLDVCCGTGTIGLTCMKEGVVGRVVGVDVSKPAIEDATRNADRNRLSGKDETASINVKSEEGEGGAILPPPTLSGTGETASINVKSEEGEGGAILPPPTTPTARFVASRAELVLAKELTKVRKSNSHTNIVAVVDPAREGLHPDVVRTLRSNESIQRLIYVSCNPTGSLVKDAGMFCAPPTKKYPGTAFQPTSAVPVDMFPLTSHCEMVMTFDRIATENENGGGND